MSIEEEIAQALHDETDEPMWSCVVIAKKSLMPLVRRAQAEALREAHADIQAYTDAGAPFGHRPVEEFLLQRADRIEQEAGA